MTSSINLAIFGLGRWGTHLLRNFLALPQAKVIAIVDPDPQRLEQIRWLYSLPPTVRSYEKWEPAMALPDLDAVVIATPASTHYVLIKRALEHRLHVLSEKPMTLDSSTSAELCRLATTQQRQLVVDHTYLFHPAVQQGQVLCQNQQLGTLRYAYATRTNLGPVRTDVDAFWDLAIHDLAILNHWLGHLPTQVLAWGQAWLQPHATAQFPSGLRDTGWLRLTYPQNLEAMLHISWLNPDKQRRLALVGDQGTLILDEMTPNAMLALHPGSIGTAEQSFTPNPQPQQVIALDTVEPLAEMGRHFLTCALNNQPSPISSGNMALALVRLIEATSQSAATGQPIRPIA
ncbi:MAG: Gfo/Idh/MocA family oxidoreductase [Leptolyngbyaceae cyanobacterium SM2_3_12]|nr:Gfo/Idh/MocA family oxidoreductase [Leptolyngbyaceae cyanobacterium SM2_3_12]